MVPKEEREERECHKVESHKVSMWSLSWLRSFVAVIKKGRECWIIAFIVASFLWEQCKEHFSFDQNDDQVSDVHQLALDQVSELHQLSEISDFSTSNCSTTNQKKLSKSQTSKNIRQKPSTEKAGTSCPILSPPFTLLRSPESAKRRDQLRLKCLWQRGDLCHPALSRLEWAFRLMVAALLPPSGCASSMQIANDRSSSSPRKDSFVKLFHSMTSGVPKFGLKVWWSICF